MMRLERQRAVRLPRTSGLRNLQIQIGPLPYRTAVGFPTIQEGVYIINFVYGITLMTASWLNCKVIVRAFGV